MITLQINGKNISLDADPEMPLLWAIRDLLGLTGTKYSCGLGLCGACTVHVDGRPQRACITPLSSVTDKKITTIEGLSENGDHPLQIAWQELNVPQCGYCQSGQLMAASALLARNKTPSDSDINSAMSGNLCRCGTYPRIKTAIQRAVSLAKEVE